MASKVTEVKLDEDIVKFTIIGIPDRPGTSAAIFEVLSENGVNVDLISQSATDEGFNNISFVVQESQWEKTYKRASAATVRVGADEVEFDREVVRITVRGCDIETQCGLAADVFRVIGDHGANMEIIGTSNDALSVIIGKEAAEDVVAALKKEFELS